MSAAPSGRFFISLILLAFGSLSTSNVFASETFKAVVADLASCGGVGLVNLQTSEFLCVVNGDKVNLLIGHVGEHVEVKGSIDRNRQSGSTFRVHVHSLTFDPQPSFVPPPPQLIGKQEFEASVATLASCPGSLGLIVKTTNDFLCIDNLWKVSSILPAPSSQVTVVGKIEPSKGGGPGRVNIATINGRKPEHEPGTGWADTLGAIATGVNQGLAASYPGSVPPPPPPPEPTPVGEQVAGAGQNVGACHPMSAYVRVESHPLSGPGHCQGEVDVTATNGSAETLTCEVVFHKSGRWTDGSTFDIAPGQSIGGFNGVSGGIMSCGTDTPTVKHMCYTKAESDAPGNDCWAFGRINWNN